MTLFYVCLSLEVEHCRVVICTELGRDIPVDVLEYTSTSMGANMMGMMNFVITCFGERESKSAYTH